MPALPPTNWFPGDTVWVGGLVRGNLNQSFLEERAAGLACVLTALLAVDLNDKQHAVRMVCASLSKIADSDCPRVPQLIDDHCAQAATKFLAADATSTRIQSWLDDGGIHHHQHVDGEGNTLSGGVAGDGLATIATAAPKSKGAAEPLSSKEAKAKFAAAKPSAPPETVLSVFELPVNAANAKLIVALQTRGSISFLRERKLWGKVKAVQGKHKRPELLALLEELQALMASGAWTASMKAEENAAKAQVDANAEAMR